MSQPGTSQQNEPARAERKLFLGGFLLAFIITLALCALELAGGMPLWPVLLRYLVVLLTLSLAASSPFFNNQKQQRGLFSWESAALLLTVLIVLTAFLTGPEFNILLAPLLVGFAQRHHDLGMFIKLGLAGFGLGFIELLVWTWLRFEPLSKTGGINLVTLAALTFSLANYLQQYYKRYRTLEKEAASKASEMEVAHEIQTSLMPPTTYTSGNWALAARSLPARNVGGDFYEYVFHPTFEETVNGVAIGDVAGKGIPAALQMAVVRTLFRVEARRRIFPAETLYSVNMALQAERSFGMVTMCYAMIDLTNNTLHLANAGHNYPLLLTQDGLKEIGLPGLPLGIDDSIEYEEEKIKIEPGNSVIFYTDGVPEAMDQEGNLFTFERFRTAIENHQELNADDMVGALLEDIAAFTQGAAQSDDITVLVLQFQPQAGEITRSDSLEQHYNFI